MALSTRIWTLSLVSPSVTEYQLNLKEKQLYRSWRDRLQACNFDVLEIRVHVGRAMIFYL